jgi:uncharacterized membrane protein
MKKLAMTVLVALVLFTSALVVNAEQTAPVPATVAAPAATTNAPATDVAPAAVPAADTPATQDAAVATPAVPATDAVTAPAPAATADATPIKVPDNVEQVVKVAEAEGAGYGTYGTIIVLLLALSTILYRTFGKKKTPKV